MDRCRSQFKLVESLEEAWEVIGKNIPTVLKFDGLAAGKGVAVCLDEKMVENFLKGRCVLSKDAERHRIAGEKLVQIGDVIASKIEFATQVANDPQVKAALESGSESAVADVVNFSDLENIHIKGN